MGTMMSSMCNDNSFIKSACRENSDELFNKQNCK